MKILLIGNFKLDEQESMLRYAQLLSAGLARAGHEVSLVAPEPVLATRPSTAGFVPKWTAYLDKYVLGSRHLGRAAAGADLVHICDHANAVYIPERPRVPYVVTCHDLLAVRGARGEATDCPATMTGKLLQRAIVKGIGRAQAIACVSAATQRDVGRILADYRGTVALVPNAMHFPYRPVRKAEADALLAPYLGSRAPLPYVLSVGSWQTRKNRAAVIEALALAKDRWPGCAVFAGEPVPPSVHALAARLGVTDRVIEVVKPSCEVLQALYSRALALLFPSRFEGFGWPLIEAQACGCAVISSSSDPLPEVAGKGALYCEANDIEAYAAAILHLASDPGTYRQLQEAGLENAARYEQSVMIGQLTQLYSSLV